MGARARHSATIASESRSMESIADEYMTQIGRIVMASSELEARLHHIFTLLASELPLSTSPAPGQCGRGRPAR